DTERLYPFKFCFYIHYTLHADELEVRYEVINSGDEPLLFSVGGHPAFSVPVGNKGSYHDHYLKFDTWETVPRWTLQNGLIAAPEAFLENENRIPLSHELFHKDALVFKKLRSDSVALLSDKHKHGLDFYFGGFP